MPRLLPSAGCAGSVCVAKVRRAASRPCSTCLVFTQADGSPLAHITINRALSRAATEAGIDRKVTPHLLRHTFASQAVLAGVPIRVVQEWLGHADISMTMRYAHLSPDGQGGMIDRLLD